MKSTYVLLTSIFLLGIIFRLWFISLAPQPPYYDQDEYERYASKMVDHGLLASHTYRSYPYPLFLAFTYKIVGFGNRHFIFFLQAIIDSLSGLLMYWILYKSFPKKSIAMIGYIIYMINPFTSGYVGVLLSEILETFFMILTVALGVYALEKITLQRCFLFGLAAGLTAETRNAAFIWTLIPLCLLFAMTKGKKMHLLAGALCGLLLSMLYPLYVNWRDYHELNITTVDSFYAKEFFNGAILKVLPPFTYSYPYEVNIMFGEYYSEYFPWRTAQDRRNMAKKYFDKGWNIIREDPLDYIKTRFYKMWYVWQKENVFFYSEPGFLQHRIVTYYTNVIILVVSLIGLVIWRLQKKQSSSSRWVWLTIVGSIVYATVGFSVTHAEYRLTIPFYPMVFMACAVGFYMIGKKLLLFHPK